MGTFVFKWEHAASEVYVTGTFDDWSKSEKLVQTGNVFEKNVTLPSAAEKIYYKFVVDGSWVTDPTAPQENDASGNLNNVLTTDRIVKHTPETAGIMSGVAPTSTTAELAKDVPLEKTGSSDLPGTFPETPAAVEKGDFSVAPLPAFDGAVNPVKLAPGEKVPHPSTFTNNTVTSGVHDDPELVAAAKKDEPEAAFSVNPLPAFPGGVNPVNVTPGDKLPEPSTITGNTIHSAVTTDKESYEKSGGLGNAPVLPPVVTPQSERDQKGTGILDLPPISKNLIPESSLPIGATGAGTFDASPAIQSSGPASTTAQLAAAVPLESSKVPEVVKESQAEAGVGPEASSVPAEVQEKSAVEKELLGHVPVAPATSEGVAGSSNSVNALSPAKDTPEVVKESIAESGQSPEAAANEEAVLEKKAVEKELLSEIKPETATGESAPAISSAGTSGGLNPPASPSKPIESRDVSPGTVPGARTAVAAGTTPEKDTATSPSTPSKATPGSSKPTESPASVSTADKAEKKKKRTSFFGKLKAKFNDKKN
ncbi:carbohydrate-binding module family 48 protein [Hyaloscypha variabilis F]|uniref:Carbohydrate-binding module family 48 protein n=1 Tax=Hyaloscypha variabilis (strain UAMH 11265 / GT02V1 / F) TaxID=1149755 RepID=A0A2J6S0H3_HYAVF|nr:carbohydrate-binding module family 48 protein [Hyaloscypha variabilis F]